MDLLFFESRLDTSLKIGCLKLGGVIFEWGPPIFDEKVTAH
jgi:hypothetical protein